MLSAGQLILGTTPCLRFLQELGPRWFKADRHGSHTTNDGIDSRRFGTNLVNGGRIGLLVLDALVGMVQSTRERSHELHLHRFFGEVPLAPKSTDIVSLVWDADRQLVPKPGVSIGPNCSRNSFDSIRWIYRGTLFSYTQRVERYAAHYRRDLCRFSSQTFSLSRNYLFI